ncbi:hypothetical protein DL546_009874 [Coniochaeta pulveracea]|uniref:BTB domain-containing protein n=1 Tax=Coniochaeta pulveracea TaxID=177199 RepID=A0A420YPC9_9PEZI|nr:hypothetical protein DL546_009874 [Coniochaeta pulveracea]
MSYRRWPGLREGSGTDEESYIEGYDCSVRRHDVVVPVFIHPCPRHPGSPSKDERELSSDEGERIKIAVGSGPSKRTFFVHKRLACRHSSYFEVALKEGNETAFVEAATGEFEWREDDAENVHRWIRWLYSCESCKLYDIYDPEHMCPEGNDDPMSWCNVDTHAEEAFILGDRIGCASYCTFALSSFIQHVHLLHPTTVLWAHENTLEHSSLHRFTAHWIAWIKFKVYQKEPPPPPLGHGIKPPGNEVPKNLEREDCSVYAEVFAHCEGWSSIDPRGYFMAHWSEPCSNVADARCCHKRICHYFASYATKFSIIEEPDAVFRLGFQLERGRLQRVREGPRPRSRWAYFDQFLVLLWVRRPFVGCSCTGDVKLISSLVVGCHDHRPNPWTRHLHKSRLESPKSACSNQWHHSRHPRIARVLSLPR